MLVTIISNAAFVHAQSSECFLFGEVILKNGDRVKGQIRWGDEELMWDDMFYAYKTGAPFGLGEEVKQHAPKDDNSVFRHFDFDFMQLWENRGQPTRRVFKCQFGDIDKIKVLSDNKATIIFKNGQRFLVTKNTNDIGSDINVFSFTGVKQKIAWNRIDQIQFIPFPEGRYSQLGVPLYGKIETIHGTFEGYIAWDKDERVSTDKLGGYHGDDKEDIPFNRIQKIEVEGDGSMVTLSSGERFFMNNHRDVNQENKGIVVKIRDLGHIIIHWEEFISAEFIEPPEPPLFYRDFYITHYLQGTVNDKRGNVYLGRLVYDLDEYLTLEVLDGFYNNMEYLLLFKNIQSIQKQNINYVKVILKNGLEVLLSGHSDVNADNQGIIIDAYGRKSLFVSWKEFKMINFK
ncbi:hypothetical protein [Chondrinema litorale]|uniref:hypothetical protein n=1 Tax=Chondrinema litorale TaxID=2994555 RepID=UPI0025433D53|nr:hypothetical protein [Chondrinema litorale]UZR95036.1 hypothetical protein OQ292_04305 [Chondrinema litorale]